VAYCALSIWDWECGSGYRLIHITYWLHIYWTGCSSSRLPVQFLNSLFMVLQPLRPLRCVSKNIGALKMKFVCIFFCWISAEKFEFLIFQGSIATCPRWGGYCHMDLIANFMRFPAVQKNWKSIKIWQSYKEFKGGNFFWDAVHLSFERSNWWVHFLSRQFLNKIMDCALIFLR